MFDFKEELKKFKPCAEANLKTFELSGDETTDLQTIVKMIMKSEAEPSKVRKPHEPLSMEDFK